MMTVLIEKTGDLFDTKAEAIGHGVNTYGLMGAGIAKSFRDHYPAMYDVYRLECSQGQIKPGDCWPWYGEVRKGGDGWTIFNIASQDKPGADATYHWLIRGTMKAVLECEESKIDVLALPYIGAGIGGLEPERVKYWLTEIAASGPVDIELWTYAPKET